MSHTYSCSNTGAPELLILTFFNVFLVSTLSEERHLFISTIYTGGWLIGKQIISMTGVKTEHQRLSE